MSEERHSFFHGERVVYQWTQNLSEINLYIPGVPVGVRTRDLRITLQPGRVAVQLHDHTYLDHSLPHTIKASESTWTYDPVEREIHILLEKAEASVVWPCVFVGHQQEGAVVEDRKRLMLERFQEEHPGFDFRGAEFTGSVPDPKTFLRQ